MTLLFLAGVPVAFTRGADHPTPGNWPFLRGPNYDGHAPAVKLLDRFPEEGPPVLWARSLGTGYSGFTAREDRVFTQYQTLGGQYVVCLEAETGKTIWQYRYEGTYDPSGLYPGPRATPTLGRGHVYFSAPSGLVGCLTEASGKLVWSRNVFDHFHVEPVEFAYSCSPVLVGEKLLLPVGRPNATMVALAADTGEVLWQSGHEAISHVPAMPISWRGQELIIGYLQNSLMAFDLETGQVRWKKSLSSGYDEHAAWPIYQEPYLWISSPFRGGSELLKLSEESRYETVWKSPLLSNDVCSSILVNGSLYGFDLRDVQAKPHRPSRGQFRCLDFGSGREHWAQGDANERRDFEKEVNDRLHPPRDPSIGHATVLYADGKLILLNDLGELILARATPQEYEELGRARVLGGEICWTPPTLVRGRLYARNHSQAVCVLLSAPDDPDFPRNAKTLTVADIPQTAYQDWASWLLPIEPEYAMDAPTIGQLTRWYVISLGGLAVAASLTACGVFVRERLPSWRECYSVTKPMERERKAIPPNHAAVCGAFLLMVFGLGAWGTTFLSPHLNEFVFTWPLCLFGVFAHVVYQTRSQDDAKHSSWRGRVWLVVFLLVSTGYFFLCRRLSLAFEWVFLAGFPAAVPALLWARRQRRPHWLSHLGGGIGLFIAFSAYYWASSLLLVWKYSLMG